MINLNKKHSQPSGEPSAYRPDYECKDKVKKRGHSYTPSLLHNKKKSTPPEDGMLNIDKKVKCHESVSYLLL